MHRTDWLLPEVMGQGWGKWLNCCSYFEEIEQQYKKKDWNTSKMLEHFSGDLKILQTSKLLRSREHMLQISFSSHVLSSVY